MEMLPNVNGWAIFHLLEYFKANNLIPDQKVYDRLEKLMIEICNNAGGTCECGHSEADHLFNHHLGTRLQCVDGMEMKESHFTPACNCIEFKRLA